MSEARILSAFYQPKSQRFVELTSQEVLARSGYRMDASAAQSLMQTGYIRRQYIAGLSKEYTYSLTGDGRARVLAMVTLGTLPKHRAQQTGRVGA